MPESEYAIECDGLTKRFGGFTAVNGVNLRIKRGEIFGFLGPNGAGKTTTIKMLTTLLTPSAGSAKVAGFDLIDDAAKVRSRIGVVPQEFALFKELTPMENLWYIGELFGMKPSVLKKRSEELLHTVGLFEKRHIKSVGFSGGMKQRLSVAAGLLHTPDILFMDEPTTGLDPQSRIALRDLTQTLNQSGITIVYTTHDMEEADKLCHRIAIMDKSRIIAEGTAAQLKAKHGSGRHMRLVLGKHDEHLLAELKEEAGAQTIRASGDHVEMTFPAGGNGVFQKVSCFLERRRIMIKDMALIEPTLEEVFINLTKKEVRD